MCNCEEKLKELERRYIDLGVKISEVQIHSDAVNNLLGLTSMRNSINDLANKIDISQREYEEIRGKVHWLFKKAFEEQNK